ncbi:hypothetical protein Tco_0388753 [Tanacetum coccineum]
MGFWYFKDTDMSLTAYSDPDHAGCLDTRRSTSGSAQFLGDKLVRWSSKKQKSTAILSTEAEYIALSGGVEQVENRIVELYFVRTEYQLADIFTKPLPRERFNFLIEKLSMRNHVSGKLKRLQWETGVMKALDNALGAPADHLEFGKCNMRLKTDIKPKQATFQVVLDALALTPFYQAFLITKEVPAIYMQEFWATVFVHKQAFEDLPLEQDTLSFIRDFGHIREITYLTDVNVDYLHQPWRAFATVINKCLSGKETRMDKIRLSRVNGVDTQPKVLDEKQQKVSGTNEGASAIPKVPDVPKYDSESEEESWTFS